MKTVIFSGTTEGRRLSEMLCEAGTEHHVCVATQYGCDIMTKSDAAHVHVGRMDSNEMYEFLTSSGFKSGDMIVDATHPYAREVSENVRKTAEKLGCTLIRVGRGIDEGENFKTENEDDIRNSYVNIYNSIEEFAKASDNLEGNILLTTGSKELVKYCKAVSADTLSRTFVRVLPSTESIEICENCGVAPANIIAMQGPFSYEMNKAVLKDLDIRHLFTKDSGRTGGFEEKVRAASDLSVYVHVYSRPGDEEKDPGVSVTEAYERITGSKYRPRRKISLIGIGPGAKSAMTLEAADAIRSAKAVFGAKRMLDSARDSGLLGNCTEHAVYRAGEIIGFLNDEVNITRIAVLFSGDTGFYSGAKEAYREFYEWDPSAEISVIPGVSSVSFLASKCLESYDDSAIVSVHGRNGLHNFKELLDTIRTNRKTFALMSDDADVRTICKMLDETGAPVTVNIGRNLSYGPSEEIVAMDTKSASQYFGKGSITVLFINNER